MQITSYFEQLHHAAATLDHHDKQLVRRAFAAAGLPSSTYYRAKHGAELKFATALQVFEVLEQWKIRGYSTHGTKLGTTDRTIAAA